jgi:PucR C-terminal helix-turn-helix domain/GGDEF-like domain
VGNRGDRGGLAAGGQGWHRTVDRRRPGVVVSGESGVPEPPAATLRSVLSFGAAEVLDVVRAPRGLDVPVAGVSLFDDGDLARAAGRVVLAVGVDVAAPRAAKVLRKAAAEQAGAVVFRCPADADVPSALLAAADETATALLVRAPGADWSDVAGLLRSGIAYASAEDTDEPRPPLGDLAALAEAIAASAGGVVTIEDNTSRVLAHSCTGMDVDPVRRQTILGGRVPPWRMAELRRSGMLRALWASPDVVHRGADPGNPERMAIAVRSGTEVLGSIWVAPDGRPLTERTRAALRDGARIAVPHLVHHRLRDRAAAQRREDALRSLLDGRGNAALSASMAGLEPEQPCAVVLAEAAPGATGGRRVLDVLALHAGAARPGAQTLRESGRLLLVLPVPDGGEHLLRDIGRQLGVIADAAVPPCPVLVAAGPVVPGALDAVRSRDAAELALRVLRDRAGRAPDTPPRSLSAHADEVAIPALVLRLLDAARPVWENETGPLHALIEHERRNGGDLLASLAAHLDADGDVPTAAHRLGVHPNTLRYRLRRLHDRFGLDLADPDTRLLAMLAVRLAHRSG